MTAEKHTSFFFLGIGGIGMSALARYVMAKGHKVFGYDKAPSVLTDRLISEGASITYSTDLDPAILTLIDARNTLVVWTPAISEENPWKRYFDQGSFACIKRATFLARVTQDTQCLAVAGTHGKTTTSSILAHILLEAKCSVTAFLGGIAQNYQSNFVSQGTNMTVVEADEFDRSFLQLHPDLACITSMDPDHLDIYPTPESFSQAFSAFADLVPKGQLFVQEDLPLAGVKVGFSDQAAVRAINIGVDQGAYRFDVVTPQGAAQALSFGMPGRHNLSNALMAVGMAASVGVSLAQIAAGLATFTGIQRRFNVSKHGHDHILIDDYAHHPTELDALYQGVNEFYPKASNVIVFQPHLYSRTRDFGPEFAKSLAQFDRVLLLPLYPARERPIRGVDSEWLCRQIPGQKAQVVLPQQLPEMIQKAQAKVTLMVGAGDIGTMVPKIKTYLDHEA
tara:strand:- start:87322 stop:88671 length:1350 start_codon:yes stop_codon:yes gene_type:complete